MKICKSCGTQNNDASLYCVSCGGKLDAAEGPICPKCGAALKPGAAFCGECGQAINAAPANNDPWAQQNNNYAQKPSQEDKPIKGGALGFVLTFFLNLVGFILALVLGDEACKKAAKITFIIEIVAGVIIGIIWAIIVVAYGAAISEYASSFGL